MVVALGAIIGAIISAMQIVSKWREEQRKENKVARKLGQAEKRVTFLDTWRRTQEPISSPERKQHIDTYVARELDILMVETLYTTEHSTSILETSRRWMLLFMPRSLWGWMARFGFFCTFPMFLLILPFCISEASRAWVESQQISTVGELGEVATVDLADNNLDTSEDTPDFSQMTIQEYGKWMTENNPESVERGVLITDSSELQNNMSSMNEDELEAGFADYLAALLFFGAITLCCYLTAVLDGRERKKPVTTERDPLPTFLRYLEDEIEIIDEKELEIRAA